MYFLIGTPYQCHILMFSERYCLLKSEGKLLLNEYGQLDSSIANVSWNPITCPTSLGNFIRVREKRVVTLQENVCNLIRIYVHITWNIFIILVAVQLCLKSNNQRCQNKELVENKGCWREKWAEWTKGREKDWMRNERRTWDGNKEVVSSTGLTALG